jgi:uncharacterized protein
MAAVADAAPVAAATVQPAGIRQALSVKIAVISDTHIGEHRKEPPARFWEIVDSADAVVHLGDWVSAEFARALSSGRTIYAVSGNCDPWSVRQMFPAERIVEFDGVKALLVHRFPSDVHAAEALAGEYKRKGVSVVLCGHTHKASDVSVAGIRVLNPGSPCDGRHHGERTAGLLTVDDGRVSWEIVTMDREV